MRRWLAAGMGALLVACDAIVGIDHFRTCTGNECDAAPLTDVAVSDAPGSDADAGTSCPKTIPLDAAAACNASSPFLSPLELVTLQDPNAALNDQHGGTFSSDGKRFYFARNTPAGFRIWMSELQNKVFQTATLVSDISPLDPDASTNDFSAVESPDGMRLYFYSYRSPSPQNYGGAFFADKTSDCKWGGAFLFADGLNQGAGPHYPVPGAIYGSYGFYLHRVSVSSNGNIDILNRVNVDADGGSGINVPVDKAVIDVVVTPDELHLYFSSFRSAPYQLHIFESDRASTSAPWGKPYMLPQGPGAINATDSSESKDSPHYITPDNCTLYFTSAASGTMKLYSATRSP